MEVNECTYEYLECQRFVFAVRNQISAQVYSLPPPFHALDSLLHCCLGRLMNEVQVDLGSVIVLPKSVGILHEDSIVRKKVKSVSVLKLFSQVVWF